jgi:hypothetical protein
MFEFRPGTELVRIGSLFRRSRACSRCGRDAAEVDRLVADASAHICDDRITTCLETLERNPAQARPSIEAERP